MIDISWEEFWWNNITGAHIVVSKVTDVLLENKMVVLKVPYDLPWRYSMRSSIHTAFQERTDAREVVIETIDVVDDNSDDLEPGRFLLQKFASSSVAIGYREKSRVSIQDYIAQKDVIKNRILWIKGLGDSTANKWINFCKGFTPKTATEGLFVLETHGNISFSESRFIEYIDFRECVSSYDVQLFNSFVLDEAENVYGSDLWKKYISTTAAMICNVDAEVSELLLRDVDFRRESAIDGIARIEKMPDFSRRGMEDGSEHVLWLYRNNKAAELNHRIWASQVQVLFPVIEMERIEIIGKYWDVISQALVENNITQYGEQIKDPMEVELGALCFMISHRQDDDMYMLYIPDGIDRERIKFLHKCRNLLAHASICDPEQVRKLLDKE